MPSALASTIPAVLARVRATIAAGDVGYAESQVLVSLFREQVLGRGYANEPHPSVGGGEFCLVAPGSFRPRGWADGGGRHVEILDGPIVVRCYARRVVDSVPSDLAALTSEAPELPGLLVRTHKLIDLLDVRFIESASGDLLTCEPLRLASHGEPYRYRVGREWAWTELRFDAAILLDLIISSEDG
jgi:hypothetical protein